MASGGQPGEYELRTPPAAAVEDADEAIAELAEDGVVVGLAVCRSSGGRRVR
jgi:hypothetical protein